MRGLGTGTRTSETSLTNIIQELEERISGIEDRIEEMNTPVKENVNLKNSWHKTSRKSGILLKD